MAEESQHQWIPRTELGKEVASGKITSIDEIYGSGRKILEPQIIDALLPDLKEEVMEVSSTQRMTAYGRKMQIRAVVIVGNRAGYIGMGIGKGVEARDSIMEAVRDAKKRLIKVNFGCGSWECNCGGTHSIPMETSGKSSSTKVTLRPAPKGVGLVAGHAARKLLELAGVRDVWSFSSGRTRNVVNMIQAVIMALEKLNKLKKGARS